MKIKAKLTEMAERVYDLAREGKYSVKVDNQAKKLKVISKRNTQHNKKGVPKIKNVNMCKK